MHLSFESVIHKALADRRCALAKEAWAPAPIKLRGLATVWAPDPLSEAGQDFSSDLYLYSSVRHLSYLSSGIDSFNSNGKIGDV